ncbi:hypothetical protein POM88_035738 [Heracleum sosnowskyi]|uniref:Replication factor A C-terminal domain-containing protein n=1 Tax=Heracleum sosnowskyi TaxID=360622 RepID=A0AAD8MDJ9_9APIA|nr:hypothetical protein POM88_035738 [Heracleum sosnowskyi]
MEVIVFKLLFGMNLLSFFAEILKGDLEYPRILIIEEVILTNVGATTFYINCNHHSVVEIRKIRINTIYTVKDIQNLGDDFIEEVRTWCHPICTSCYKKVEIVDNEDTCNFCKRIVPYEDKKFEVYMTASDETGSILLILEDREVRTLMGKTVFQMMNEVRLLTY